MIAARQTSKYFPRPSHIVHFRLKQVWNFKRYNKIICNLKKLRFNFSFKVCVQFESSFLRSLQSLSILSFRTYLCLKWDLRGNFVEVFRENLTNVHPAAAGGAKAQKICNFTSSSFHITNQCTMGLSPLKRCIKEFWQNVSFCSHFPAV